MNEEPVRVLGVAGSLRRRSYNRALIGAARGLAPEGMEIDAFDLREIPPYDADVERSGDPRAVRDLKAAIADADALLIATPEYQHSIPGLLKNALDWASRPPRSSVLRRKPAAVMGATPGRTATARAQADLKKVLAYNDMHVLHSPGVLIANAASLFDEALELTDAATRDRIESLLEQLGARVRWLRRSPPPEPGDA